MKNKKATSIYNASAGAGKTYTLVKEYLKIIFTANSNDAYKNILAITFTNKAVFEMKKRIIAALFECSSKNPTQKTIDLIEKIKDETTLNENQIQEKAQAIIKNIIHNYTAFDILTIDKFTHKIIRTFAFDLGLNTNFDVSLDSKKLLQEAVDALVAMAGENEELTKVLIDFTIQKTNDDKSWDISQDIYDSSSQLLNENYNEALETIQDKTIADFVAFKILLKQKTVHFKAENIQLASQILNLLETNNIDLKSFSAQNFPKHIISIIENNFNNDNKKYFEFEHVLINKTAKDKAQIEALIPEMLLKLAQIYEQFNKIAYYENVSQNLTPLSLVKLVNGEFEKIQSDNNVVSISEFNSIISEHLKNQPAPFIYERMGERYHHFFIDEFQDTSQLQWENLFPLIDNALSTQFDNGDKGSLLLVGDPKQSIYRFRGGKAEQFMQLTNNILPFNNSEKEVVNLEYNFRSFDQIINFNNQFFSFIASKFNNTDYINLYKNNSFQKATTKKGGYVNIKYVSKDSVEISEKNYHENNEDLEEETNTLNAVFLETTLQTIKNVKNNNFEYNEIVILIRNNKEGILLANYLNENEIPIISAESLLLKASSQVQFLVNSLHYLVSAKNKQNLAEMLYYFATYNCLDINKHEFIYLGLQAENETDLEAYLKNYQVNIHFEQLRQKSLYEAVELLIKKAILPENNTAYVQYFLDEILDKEIKYQYTITEFLEFWDEKSNNLSIPIDKESNSVQIMTIHKAKGLEFPVVIYTFVRQYLNKASQNEKIWINSSQELSFDSVLINKKNGVENYSKNASESFIKINEDNLLDNINVLYVALTRAEEQLYIIAEEIKISSKGKYPNKIAAFFVEFLNQNQLYNSEILEYEFGSPKRVSVFENKENNTQLIQSLNETLPFENIKIAKRDALMWGTPQQNAIEYGNTIHEILSYIEYPTDIENAIEKAVLNGLITVENKIEIQKTISEIIFDPNLKEFFPISGKILNEQIILKNNEIACKPDRIVLQNKNAYLLDYKTGDQLPKHVIQINYYKTVLEEMGYQVLEKKLVYISNQIQTISV